MRRINELHLEHPFAGSRMLRDMLRLEGDLIGRIRARRLMKKMGIEALRKPSLSRRNNAQPIYRYLLLRDLKIERFNHVWATDITYIPIRLSDTGTVARSCPGASTIQSTNFCLDAVRKAIARYGRPEIFNTDQGSQFPSHELTQLLKDNEIRISMNGKGCWQDNVFVERLWKSVKYEEFYLNSLRFSRRRQDPFGCVSELL